MSRLLLFCTFLLIPAFGFFVSCGGCGEVSSHLAEKTFAADAFGTGYSIDKSEQNPGEQSAWLVTLQKTNAAGLSDVVIDPRGYIYVIGGFWGTLHFKNKSIISKGLNPKAMTRCTSHKFCKEPGWRCDFSKSRCTPPSNIFLAKIDSKGGVLWFKHLQIESGDDFKRLTLGKSGNIYIAGSFKGSASLGKFKLNSPGVVNPFVAKLSSDGRFLWAQALNSKYFARATALSFGDGKSFYVAGDFQDRISYGKKQLQVQNKLGAIFVIKFDSEGSFIWAKSVPIKGSTSVTSLNFHPKQGLWIAGIFIGELFAGNTMLKSWDSNIAFLFEMSTSGTFKKVSSIKGEKLSSCQVFALEVSSSLHLAGRFNGSILFGNRKHTANDPSFAFFVSKLDLKMNFIETVSGSATNARVNTLAVGQNETVYAAGVFSGTMSFNGIKKTAGAYSAFFGRLNSLGKFTEVNILTPKGDSQIQKIRLDANGNIYAIGYFLGEMHLGPLKTSVKEQVLFISKFKP